MEVEVDDIYAYEDCVGQCFIFCTDGLLFDSNLIWIIMISHIICLLSLISHRNAVKV